MQAFKIFYPEDKILNLLTLIFSFVLHHEIQTWVELMSMIKKKLECCLLHFLRISKETPKQLTVLKLLITWPVYWFTQPCCRSERNQEMYGRNMGNCFNKPWWSQAAHNLIIWYHKKNNPKTKKDFITLVFILTSC